MSYALGKLDKTATFLATSTSKLGKKEITIYPIQLENGNKFTISTSLSNTFELDQDSEIVSFDWVYSAAPSNGTSKRRLSNGPSKKSNGTSSSYLAVSLKNKTVLIFSPFQSHVVSEVKSDVLIHDLASSTSSYWILGSTEAIEFELNDSKPKNKVKIPKGIKNVTTLESVTYKKHHYLAVGGDKLILINPKTQETFAEFETGKAPIIQIKLLNGCALVARRDSNIISVYSLSKDSTKFLTASSKVVSLIALSDHSIAALTSNGALEIFENFNQKKPSSSIKSNSTEIKFIDAVTKDSNILVTWFDFEPRFELISTSDLEDIVEVNVKHESKVVKSITKQLEPVVFDIEPIPEFNVRESALSALIEEKIDSPFELLQILVSNEDQEKIKMVLTTLNDTVSSKLYATVSSRVESNPAESAALNNWLKWVLITNSGLAKSDPKVQSLKDSLSKSLKQLPNLLSLQGRLELLQSQLQLRTEIAQQENVDDSEKPNLLAKAEENIVYINGENDDSDGDAIGSAGDSEGEEEEQKERDEGEVENGGNNIEADEE